MRKFLFFSFSFASEAISYKLSYSWAFIYPSLFIVFKILTIQLPHMIFLTLENTFQYYLLIIFSLNRHLKFCFILNICDMTSLMYQFFLIYVKINTYPLKKHFPTHHLNLQNLSYFLWSLLGILVEFVYIWLTY